jgi:hypothetical protein
MCHLFLIYQFLFELYQLLFYGNLKVNFIVAHMPLTAIKKDPEPDLKNSLSAHGRVMKRLNMLTYYLYAALSRRCMPCPKP